MARTSQKRQIILRHMRFTAARQATYSYSAVTRPTPRSRCHVVPAWNRLYWTPDKPSDAVLVLFHSDDPFRGNGHFRQRRLLAAVRPADSGCCSASIILSSIGEGREPSLAKSAVTVAVWCLLAIVFNGLVWWRLGGTAGVQFASGYLLEWSMSMDNVFVFAVIFRYFQVPKEHQYRVLFWGILGAVLMRLGFILAGTALIARFDFVLPMFGIFLIYTAYRLAWHSPAADRSVADARLSPGSPLAGRGRERGAGSRSRGRDRSNESKEQGAGSARARCPTPCSSLLAPLRSFLRA